MKSKVWWSMQDLKEHTGYSEDWLKEHILLHPRYKPMLDIENGGFVYYPERKGERWCFIASRMEEFLEKHFKDIFLKKGKHHMQIKNISLDELPSGVREVADRALAEWKVRLPVRELARMLNRTIPSIRNQIELLRRKGLI